MNNKSLIQVQVNDYVETQQNKSHRKLISKKIQPYMKAYSLKPEFFEVKGKQVVFKINNSTNLSNLNKTMFSSMPSMKQLPQKKAPPKKIDSVKRTVVSLTDFQLLPLTTKYANLFQEIQNSQVSLVQSECHDSVSATYRQSQDNYQDRSQHQRLDSLKQSIFELEKIKQVKIDELQNLQERIEQVKNIEKNNNSQIIIQCNKNLNKRQIRFKAATTIQASVKRWIAQKKFNEWKKKKLEKLRKIIIIQKWWQKQLKLIKKKDKFEIGHNDKKVKDIDDHQFIILSNYSYKLKRIRILLVERKGKYKQDFRFYLNINNCQSILNEEITKDSYEFNILIDLITNQIINIIQIDNNQIKLYLEQKNFIYINRLLLQIEIQITQIVGNKYHILILRQESPNLENQEQQQEQIQQSQQLENNESIENDNTKIQLVHEEIPKPQLISQDSNDVQLEQFIKENNQQKQEENNQPQQEEKQEPQSEEKQEIQIDQQHELQQDENHQPYSEEIHQLQSDQKQETQSDEKHQPFSEEKHEQYSEVNQMNQNQQINQNENEQIKHDQNIEQEVEYYKIKLIPTDSDHNNNEQLNTIQVVEDSTNKQNFDDEEQQLYDQDVLIQNKEETSNENYSKQQNSIIDDYPKHDFKQDIQQFQSQISNNELIEVEQLQIEDKNQEIQQINIQESVVPERQQDYEFNVHIQGSIEQNAQKDNNQKEEEIELHLKVQKIEETQNQTNIELSLEIQKNEENNIDYAQKESIKNDDQDNQDIQTSNQESISVYQPVEFQDQKVEVQLNRSRDYNQLQTLTQTQQVFNKPENSNINNFIENNDNNDLEKKSMTESVELKQQNENIQVSQAEDQDKVDVQERQDFDQSEIRNLENQSIKFQFSAGFLNSQGEYLTSQQFNISFQEQDSLEYSADNSREFQPVYVTTLVVDNIDIEVYQLNLRLTFKDKNNEFAECIFNMPKKFQSSVDFTKNNLYVYIMKGHIRCLEVDQGLKIQRFVRKMRFIKSVLFYLNSDLFLISLHKSSCMMQIFIFKNDRLEEEISLRKLSKQCKLGLKKYFLSIGPQLIFSQGYLEDTILSILENLGCKN
ncbi:unnamed protein product (macronuclear) [Paramecium tetraurelia]|uniref:IQ calmodulin-binding motif protein n=1 Tax=Paramecium tetraurelia TaxID=5888 RepID=A0BTE4_PARTE|nr:uncharacterized protein GSPATT00032043001 [Paramecium tetraurelia]CAK61811.1 unnamed protein product [Paramecium tetraurelia]|eukprot:XP_001429209.1 hypothetical protein (macronuclear) [Paramecium tetraurelia strain d4-2]